MAVALRAFSTIGFTGDGSAVITKPSGLAEGDIMIVTLVTCSTSATINTPSGWTSLASGTPESGTIFAIYYKVASSADASADDFTFTFTSGGTNTEYGSIIALSDCAVDFVTDTGSDTIAQATYTGGITPPQSNSFLVMVGVSGSVAVDVDLYTIATSSPIWTERDETSTTNENDATVAIATAIKGDATATGDFGMTYNNSTNSIGVLIGVGTAVDEAVTLDVLTLTGALPATGIAGDANVTLDLLTVASSIKDMNQASTDGKWTNTSKNAATNVTNTSKS